MLMTMQRWREYPAEDWSDVIVAAMKLGGIDYLFFISGTEMAFFQEAVAKAEQLGRPTPKLMTVVHENVALNAAIGYSMMTGKPAATAVHVDVETLHMGAAIHPAWHDRSPVLMTAGAGPRALPIQMGAAVDAAWDGRGPVFMTAGAGPGAFANQMAGGGNTFINWVQEPRDQCGILRQYSKLDHRLEHTDNPGLAISRLLQVAMSEPQGPVYLSIPRESAMLPLPGAIRFPTHAQMGTTRPTSPDPQDARSVARWLVKSHNPVLFTARIGQDPRAVPEFVRLAELLAIPVTESSPISTRMNFPATHPLYGVGPSAQDADVVLVIDDLTPYTPGVNGPGPDTKVVWVTPDPVNSRYKTMEYEADLWISCTPANFARSVHEEATRILDKADLA